MAGLHRMGDIGQNLRLCGLALVVLWVRLAPVHTAEPRAVPAIVSAEEFIGPFASWADAKRDYGAVGDGKTDDTAALQKALDDLKLDKKPKVLYLPAGTYRITQGLTMASTINVGVLGADPATTTLRWDGPADGTMLYCNGVSYSRFGRITWDGGGKAKTAVDHGWDGKVPYANTDGEHADEVFKDVAFGIRGGSHGFMDAECAVLRCRFQNCSKAGISIENFNALDWFVWYSSFENCHFGVTNTYGAGNFHVYESVFRKSTEADVSMGNCEYFSMRGNYSIGSKAFFVGGWNGCAGLVTLQDNTVVDTTDPTSIQVGNLGPFLCVDNVVLNHRARRMGEEAIHLNSSGTALLVGNTFSDQHVTDANIPELGSVRRTIDNRVLTGFETPPEPVLPPTPQNYHRHIIEVSSGANATAVQHAIDQAVALTGQRAVVHLHSGQYQTDKSLIIPANSGVQIIGDGFTTQFTWAGQGAGPVLRLEGPSRATLRDFSVSGANMAEGVAVENCDQPKARVFMEQGNAQGGTGVGLLADGLDNTDVSLHDFYHSGCKEVGVKAIGGPLMADDKPMPGRVVIFGGASSNNTVSYDVQNGGRILAEDIWYEGAPPRFIRLDAKSSGSLTLNGATIATADPNHGGKDGEPAVEVNEFRGDLTIVNAIFSTRLVINGISNEANVFCMAHGNDGFFNNRSTEAHAVLFGSTKYTPGGGAVTIPDQGNAGSVFVRKMLAQLRVQRPRSLTSLPGGVTDVRVYRVNVSNCPVDFHLKAH